MGKAAAVAGETVTTGDIDHVRPRGRGGQVGRRGVAVITDALMDIQHPVAARVAGGALCLTAHKGAMGREARLEAILVGMAGGAVDPDIMGGVGAAAVPIVRLGMADLADAGGRAVGGIDKAALGIKKFDLPLPAAGGGDHLADELAIEQAKGVRLPAVRGLGTVRGTDVAGTDGALDDDLAGGGGQHREGVDGIGLVQHQDEAAARGAGALVVPDACRP